MNQQEIMQILPHRPPMLLLDQMTLQEDGSSAASYHFRGDEWFFQGHFPEHPVVPGLVLCEIMAQSASVLIRQYAVDGTLPYLIGLDKTRFHRGVFPGETFETQCKLTKVRKPFFYFNGVGSVNGKVCLKTDFSVILVDPQ